MSTSTPDRAVRAAGRPVGHRHAPTTAGGAVTRLAWRQIRRGTGVLVVVSAGMSAAVAALYADTVGGAGGVEALRALAGQPAIRTLFGPPLALDTPGGFTVWRTGTPLAVLIGAWALLTATRITRGEEDAGRWELLLAGRVPRARVVAVHLGVLAAAIVLVGAGVAAALVAAGTDAPGALVHAGALTGLALGLGALGALTAQILPTRSGATGAGIALLSAGVGLRMVADGSDALSGLRWATPFGVGGATRAYAPGQTALPLLELLAVAVVLAAAAVGAAGRRDVRAGLVAARDHRAPRRVLLSSPAAWALRRALRPLAGWTAGVVAFGVLVGGLAGSVAGFLGANRALADLAAAAGFPGLGTASGYVGVVLTLLGVPAGAWAASRLAAAAGDDAAGRTVLLLAAPVTRTRLVVGECAVAAAGLAVLVTAAGLAVGLAGVATGTDVGVGAALGGAWNAVPVALLGLGAALVGWGWVPRATFALGLVPGAGGFLADALAQSTGAPAWVRDLGPYAHLAPVPGADPDVAGAVGMVVVAVVLGVVGAVGLHRRDVGA